LNRVVPMSDDSSGYRNFSWCGASVANYLGRAHIVPYDKQ